MTTSTSESDDPCLSSAHSRAFLVGPWTGRASVQYAIAGILLAIGVVLWVVTEGDAFAGLKPSGDELAHQPHRPRELRVPFRGLRPAN